LTAEPAQSKFQQVNQKKMCVYDDILIWIPCFPLNDFFPWKVQEFWLEILCVHCGGEK
jgi:hypothetical protein